MGMSRDIDSAERLQDEAYKHLSEIDRQIENLTDEYMRGRETSIVSMFDSGNEALIYAQLLTAKSGVLQAIATLDV